MSKYKKNKVQTKPARLLIAGDLIEVFGSEQVGGFGRIYRRPTYRWDQVLEVTDNDGTLTIKTATTSKSCASDQQHRYKTPLMRD